MSEGLFPPPRGHRREKPLIYGGYKIGKSSLWLDVLNTFHQYGQTDVHFFIVDSDYGYEELVADEYPHLMDTEMVTLFNPETFEDFIDARIQIRAEEKRGDWVVVDLMKQPWEAAQEHYIQKVYGEDPWEYLIAMRKEVVAKGGKDPRSYGGHDGMNWGFITRNYNQFDYPLTLKSKAHVFGVTEERKLDEARGADPEKIKRFRIVGKMEPVGQKGIGHRFSTVMRMTQKASGQRQLTMVGDRGREKKIWPAKMGLDDKGELNRILDIDASESFVQRYLVDVVGWRLETGKKDGGRRRRRAPEVEKPKRRRK